MLREVIALTAAAGAVARAAAVLVAFNIIAKVTALFREVVTARQFGATAGMDAYLVAYAIPSVLFYLFTGALATVVVPVYSEYAAAGRQRQAQGLFGTLFWALLALLAAATAAGLVLAPQLVGLLAPGLPAGTRALAVELTRVMFPLLVFSGLGALFTGLLNARDIFGVTALNAPLQNAAVIAAVLIAGGLWGVHGLALGVLAGGAAAALVQVPALLGTGFNFRPGVPLNHPDLKKILRLVLPVTVGLSISQTYILIDRYLASGLAEGSISALNYANRLIQMPVGLFVTAVGTAVFPSLTRRAAGSDLEGLASGVRRALELVVLVCLPAAAVFAVLPGPLVVLFYQRGAFDERASVMTAAALFFYSFGLLGQAAEFILARGFFALQDTRTPVVLSALAVGVNLALSLALVGPMRHAGLALANSIAALFNAVLLAVFLHRRLEGQLGRGLARFILRAAAAGAVLAAVLAAGAAAAGLDGARGTVWLLTRLSAVTGAGLAAYAAALYLLGFEEVRRAAAFLRVRPRAGLGGEKN